MIRWEDGGWVGLHFPEGLAVRSPSLKWVTDDFRAFCFTVWVCTCRSELKLKPKMSNVSVWFHCDCGSDWGRHHVQTTGQTTTTIFSFRILPGRGNPFTVHHSYGWSQKYFSDETDLWLLHITKGSYLCGLMLHLHHRNSLTLTPDTVELSWCAKQAIDNPAHLFLCECHLVSFIKH